MLADNPVEDLNEHLSMLVGRYIPPRSLCVTKISLSLIIIAGMLLASSRWLIFGGPLIALGLTGKSLSAVKGELYNETFSEIMRQFSDKNRDVLMNVHSPHKLWSTLKSAMFGPSSSLPRLVSECGGLECESIVKADLLSDHFYSKQSREAVDLPLTCHPCPSLTTFTFRSSEVCLG